MKVITSPTVTIVSKTHFIGAPSFDIPDDGDDAVKLGSLAAKICYASSGKDGRSNIENQSSILESRHGSILEHIHVSIFIEGITRALSLELNRHRNLAISQRSTRYVKEEDSAIVLEPYYASIWEKYGGCKRGKMGWWPVSYPSDSEVDGPERAAIDGLLNILESSEDSIISYQHEVDALLALNPNNLTGFDLRKWSRGKARNILPHALETQVLYTANLRTWRWIIEVRSGKGAEPEIRRLAHVLLQTLKSSVSLYFDEFEVSEIYDGIPVYVPRYSKV